MPHAAPCPPTCAVEPQACFSSTVGCPPRPSTKSTLPGMPGARRGRNRGSRPAKWVGGVKGGQEGRSVDVQGGCGAACRTLCGSRKGWVEAAYTLGAPRDLQLLAAVWTAGVCTPCVVGYKNLRSCYSVSQYICMCLNRALHRRLTMLLLQVFHHSCPDCHHAPCGRPLGA
jgi:hypothetical protein